MGDMVEKVFLTTLKSLIDYIEIKDSAKLMHGISAEPIFDFGANINISLPFLLSKIKNSLNLPVKRNVTKIKDSYFLLPTLEKNKSGKY
jgi:hypothetical protein